MYCSEDRIAAQASARGTARRGIVRLSGPDVLKAISPFFESNEPIDSRANFICSGRFYPWPDPKDRLSVSCDLYYWSQGGFTGESAAELHLPGSPPILQAVLRRICSSGDVRLAERGEFTLRAFLNGRIDLTQAEAILGVIDAEDSVDLTTALAQLAGGLGVPLEELRESLLTAVADLEAGLDFTEEDIQFISRSELRSRIESVLNKIEQIDLQIDRRSGGPEAPTVVLWGLPNSGKSSLFNALVRKVGGSRSENTNNSANPVEAIVSPTAGTTRDYLEFSICRDGLRWTLVDTAGIDTVDFQQMNRVAELHSERKDNSQNDNCLAQSFQFTQKAKDRAELILLCLDSMRIGNDFPLPEELSVLENEQNKIILVATKKDICSKNDLDIAKLLDSYLKKEKKSNTENSSSPEAVFVSSVTEEGIVELLDAVSRSLTQGHPRMEVVPATADRCRESLRSAERGLKSALDLTVSTDDDVLIAAELRAALDQIGLVTGAVHTDDILDRIFSHFCIGK